MIRDSLSEVDFKIRRRILFGNLCVRDAGKTLKRLRWGGGKGQGRRLEYSPLYKKGIKKT